MLDCSQWQNKTEAGATLLELLLVLAVIGLIVIMSVRYFGITIRGVGTDAAAAFVRDAVTAANQYMSEQGIPPLSLEANTVGDVTAAAGCQGYLASKYYPSLSGCPNVVTTKNPVNGGPFGIYVIRTADPQNPYVVNVSLAGLTGAVCNTISISLANQSLKAGSVTSYCIQAGNSANFDPNQCGSLGNSPPQPQPVPDQPGVLYMYQGCF